MSGLLLDTHALYWLVSGEVDLAEEALFAIGESQETGSLFVSPVTVWELAVAIQKPRADRRPNLGAASPDDWFREAVRATAARVVPIQQRISYEAARVVAETGHKDPGDCFLMATARSRRIAMVTRDNIIRGIAADRADYLDVVVC